MSGALLQACLHGPSRVAADPEQMGHCLRIAGLNAGGGAAVVETRARSGTRYHLTSHADAPVVSVGDAQCQAEGACGPQGLLLAPLGLQPPSGFEVGQTTGAGSVQVPLPGLGPRKISLARSENRFGKQEWTVAVDHEADGWVLYQAPGTLDPERARWFVAGDLLWLEVETGSAGVSCLVASADLREAAAGMLDDAAVDLLRDARFADAEQKLRRAIEIKPDDATAAYNLACALALQGRQEDAVQWLERSFLLDEHNRLRQLARRDPDLESLWTRDDFLFLVSP